MFVFKIKKNKNPATRAEAETRKETENIVIRIETANKKIDPERKEVITKGKNSQCERKITVDAKTQPPQKEARVHPALVCQALIPPNPQNDLYLYVNNKITIQY